MKAIWEIYKDFKLIFKGKYWNLESLFPFQITPAQKMTEVTSRDHEASLISPTTETEGA